MHRYFGDDTVSACFVGSGVSVHTTLPHTTGNFRAVGHRWLQDRILLPAYIGEPRVRHPVLGWLHTCGWGHYRKYTLADTAPCGNLPEYWHPSNIEDIWQSVMGMSYWRNGPVLNNALSGVDMALWDIKGKMAGMPLYQLFGGKCRAAIPCYTHAEGDSVDVVLERVAALKELGYRKIRVQVGGYGGKNPSLHRPENSPPGAYFDPKSYIRNVLNLMEILHVKYGGELEFCHDTHERLSPIDAVNFAKELEPYHLLFLEDALPPEQSDWFRILRQQCATPLAMGELFNNPQEWKHLVQEHLIDYIRIHVSQIGGITPARKVIAFCDAYGVRTAWHGPIDMTPIGHAVNAHLDISCPNLGVQEWTDGLSGLYPTLNGRLMQEIFPGMPERRDGYLYLNDKPGIGVDINEELAARYPCKNTGISWNWMLARLPDGTAVRP